MFADIGAGTGILTALLAQCGFNIFAVEPNADMLKQLAITCTLFPDVKIIDGTAEATTLPDNCVDVIANAQALRRFELDLFRAECLRIGKPNLIVISIYNGETKLSPEYKKIMDAFYRNSNMREFPNPIYFTRDRWLLYHSSMEGVPMEGDVGYEAYTAELNNQFDRESVDGVLRLELMTYVYSGKMD